MSWLSIEYCAANSCANHASSPSFLLRVFLVGRNLYLIMSKFDGHQAQSSSSRIAKRNIPSTRSSGLSSSTSSLKRPLAKTDLVNEIEKGMSFVLCVCYVFCHFLYSIINQTSYLCCIFIWKPSFVTSSWMTWPFYVFVKFFSACVAHSLKAITDQRYLTLRSGNVYF